MIIHKHDCVGATLAVALSNVVGRGKPCPYNIKRALCAEIFVVMYNHGGSYAFLPFFSFTRKTNYISARLCFEQKLFKHNGNPSNG